MSNARISTSYPNPAELRLGHAVERAAQAFYTPALETYRLRRNGYAWTTGWSMVEILEMVDALGGRIGQEWEVDFA